MAWISSIMSAKSMFMMAILGAALYYGWPLVEAIILILPIPDPKGSVDAMKNLGNSA